MRRLIIAAAVAASGASGLLLAAAPAAHADGQVCVAVNANGTQPSQLNQCYALPSTPTLP